MEQLKVKGFVPPMGRTFNVMRRGEEWAHLVKAGDMVELVDDRPDGAARVGIGVVTATFKTNHLGNLLFIHSDRNNYALAENRRDMDAQVHVHRKLTEEYGAVAREEWWSVVELISVNPPPVS